MPTYEWRNPVAAISGNKKRTTNANQIRQFTTRRASASISLLEGAAEEILSQTRFTLYTTPAESIFYFRMGRKGTLAACYLYCGNSLLSDAIFDVHHNGATIFGDPATRPRILAGNSWTEKTLSRAVLRHDEVRVDLDSINSSGLPAPITVIFVLR